MIFQNASSGERLRFSDKFACKQCGIAFQEPEPALFSFNSPAGACPRCQGFGNTIDYDMDLVIPDTGLTLEEGAVEPWTKPKGREWFLKLKRAMTAPKGRKIRLTVPFCDLTAEEKDYVIEGAPGFGGIRGFFNYLETKKYKLHVRVFLSRYRGYARCPECNGARLRKEALYVRVGGQNLADVVRMNIAEAQAFFDALELTPEETAIAEKILIEIRQRLKFLNDVGLDYLTLDRLSATLSGGEAQRIQLATCLGSRLVGACYVLDEPSIGLHTRDTGRLIRILEELRGLGNTILVVEHDPEVMRSADHIVDLGPGAGENGGEVDFRGLLRRPDAKRECLAYRPVPARGTTRFGGSREARFQSAARAAHFRRPSAQPQEHRRRNSARHAGVRYRRLGIGQIDPGARRALSLARSDPAENSDARRDGRARSGRGAGIAGCQDVLPAPGWRPAVARSGAGGSIAHRPHAALESGDLHQGVRPDSQRCSRQRRKPRSAATPPGTSRSTFRAGAARSARAMAR